ncbi:MAG: DegV family EDD domain-containing protein [Lachnospiraceae bacterium]|nr:DegV family EDD domain-containing protein [Lachnospiraceae bacterium]
MMGPKKWFRSIRNRNLDLQERLFRLLVLIGLCGLAVAIINGIVIGEETANIIPLIIAFVILAGIVYCSLHFHKIQMGAVIIGAIIIYFVLPFNFLTTGGIFGGAPIYLLFGMVYVCLVVEGKIKYIFLASSFIVNAVCYYIAYNNPTLVSNHTQSMAYTDSVMSLLIVGVWICGMLIFQNAIFCSENAISKQQNKEIEELNRAQNRFFSSMSHEIRTPINTIIGLNEMILREDVSDEVAADAINIQGASKMLLSLINDFLDVSKIESGKMDIVPVTYNVGDMLSDIVNMIWVRAKDKGLEFHINVDPSVPAQLYGDEVRIKQILINVLNNAVKYTQKGSVTLSIQNKGNQSDQAQICYSVTDTGMGIKEESIPHLFSAFKRVDEENNRHIEGTGLGLSIVKQLVDLMGGNITVNSVYTKGSTFIITLPQKIAGDSQIGTYSLEAKRARGARERYKQSFEAPRARILIVDDSETNLMVAEKLLRATKVQIETVTSGKECLKSTIQNRFDVILMDHLMPGMDGIECMQAIRTQTGGLNQNTPIIILTANAGGDNKSIYRKEGFDGYLLKPISGIQLEEELLKHLPGEIVNMTGNEGSVGVVETPTIAHKDKLPVLITTESVCDLPNDLVEKYQIAVMPYRVVTDGGEFLDSVEIEMEGLLSYISGSDKKNARSEESTVAECEEFFAKQVTKAQTIVHITMAKNVSLGYANAIEAANAFDNIIVVDSGHLTCGMGLMVLQAAKYAVDGMSAEAIARELEVMKKSIKTSFIMESTEYLARSGRLATKIHEVCDALMLHPVIVLKNSSLKVGGIKMGTQDYVRSKYVSSTFRDAEEVDTELLFIAHTGLTKEELEDVKEQVQRKVKFRNIIYQKASSAISANCGPRTVSLCFMMK